MVKIIDLNLKTKIRMGYYFRQTYRDIKKRSIILHDIPGSAEDIKHAFIAKNDNNSVSIIIAKDGTIVNCYDPIYWSYSLGKGCDEKGYKISKSSISIALSNSGPLLKANSYLNKFNLPEYSVVKLDKEYRGYLYYDEYRSEQMIALRFILLDLASRFDIPIRSGIQTLISKGKNSFNLQSSAMQNKEGLWVHANFSKSVNDCSPQPILIETILSL
jgi:hypothetical protein